MAKHTNTLSVLHISASATAGGGPQHIATLIRHLQKIGIKNYICCPNDFPYWGIFEGIISSGRMTQIPHKEICIKSIINVAQFIKSKNISVVHSHGRGAGIYGRLAAYLTRRPSVHTFHGAHTQSLPQPTRLVYSCIERALASITQHFIAVSKSEYETIINLKFAPARKLITIANGIEIPTAPPQRKNNTDLTLLHVTRFDDAKNSDLLIPIISHLKKLISNFKIKVAGDGPGKNAFKNKIRNLGLENHVTILGYVPEMDTLYSSSDIVISTSKSEGLPLALLEAFAVGTPVVATTVPGNSDIITHGVDGFLFPINRPDTAAQHIHQLHKPDTWNMISNNCIKTSRLYTASTMAEMTAAIYNAMCD